MNNLQKRQIINGTWYEVCVEQDGEIRDVITESSLYDAEKRTQALAKQWPNCDMIFVRQHVADVERGPGASKFHVIRNLTLDFRVTA